MNDDALAAVIAAAQLIAARHRSADMALRAESRWNLAGRFECADGPRLRRIALTASRWASSRRLRE